MTSLNVKHAMDDEIPARERGMLSSCAANVSTTQVKCGLAPEGAVLPSRKPEFVPSITTAALGQNADHGLDPHVVALENELKLSQQRIADQNECWNAYSIAN